MLMSEVNISKEEDIMICLRKVTLVYKWQLLVSFLERSDYVKSKINDNNKTKKKKKEKEEKNKNRNQFELNRRENRYCV